MNERYHNVWQRGYEAGAEDATRALVELWRRGGQVTQDGFGDGIAVRYPSGQYATASSLLALRPYRPGPR